MSVCPLTAAEQYLTVQFFQVFSSSLFRACVCVSVFV